MEGDVSGVFWCAMISEKHPILLFEIYFGKFDIQIIDTFQKNRDLGGLFGDYMLDYHF